MTAPRTIKTSDPAPVTTTAAISASPASYKSEVGFAARLASAGKALASGTHISSGSHSHKSPTHAGPRRRSSQRFSLSNASDLTSLFANPSSISGQSSAGTLSSGGSAWLSGFSSYGGGDITPVPNRNPPLPAYNLKNAAWQSRSGSYSIFSASPRLPRYSDTPSAHMTGLSPAPTDYGELPKRVAIAGRRSLRILAVNQASPTSLDSHAEPQFREQIDLLKHSKLSKAYGITDVCWGYSASKSKIATSCLNGSVVVWDLNISTSNKVQRVTFEHDRAVNKAMFAGGKGNWLVSCGQDGNIKIWDLRAEGPASSVLSQPHDPVRDVAISPDPLDPYTLMSCNESGFLLRWNLRNTKSPTDRVLAHIGGALCLDWRQDESALHMETIEGERRNLSGTGWLATAGMDRTVKIWDMSSHNLPSKATHTLNSADPVQRVKWRKGRPCEIITTPLRTMSTAEDVESRVIGPDMEIWDVRRESIPKSRIDVDNNTIAGLAVVADDLLWTVSRSTAMLRQHDMRFEEHKVFKTVPKTLATWMPDGSLFMASTIKSGKNRYKEADIGTDNDIAQTIAPEQTIASIPDMDSTFSLADFRFLAEGYRTHGAPIEEICNHNASAALTVGKYDAMQVWKTIGSWFAQQEANFIAAVTTEPPKLATNDMSRKQSQAPTVNQDQPVHHRYISRPSSQAARSRPSSRVQSPAPSDQVGERPPTARPHNDLLASDSDDSIEGSGDASTFPNSSRRPSSAHSAQRLAFRRSLSPSRLLPGNVSRGRSRLAMSEYDEAPGTMKHSFHKSEDVTPTPPLNRLAVHKLETTDSGSDVEDEKIDPVERPSRLRERKKRSELRKFTGSSTSRSRTREHVVSSFPMTAVKTFDDSLLKALEDNTIQPKRMVGPEMTPDEALTRRLKAHLKTEIYRYAELGDPQMAYTMSAVLYDTLEIDSQFVQRITQSYISLLRTFNLHSFAAAIIKHSHQEQIREYSLTNTTIYTACGSCSKGLVDAPHARCKRCRATTTTCTICHLPESQGFLFCGECAHGAHYECVERYINTQLIASRQISAEIGGGNDITDLSVFVDRAEGLAEMMRQCPSGCGHLYCAIPSIILRIRSAQEMEQEDNGEILASA